MRKFWRRSGNTRVLTTKEAEADPTPEKAKIVLDPTDPREAETLREIEELCTSDHRCGDCVHYSREYGKQRLNDPHDAILPRLVQSQMKSVVGALDLRQIGLCTHWSSSNKDPYLVHATSPARVPRWYVDTQVQYGLRDRTVSCPAYRKNNGRIK